jgi:hypothetical protein
MAASEGCLLDHGGPTGDWQREPRHVNRVAAGGVMAMYRMMWALVAVALLTIAAAARAQTGGGCDRACLIELTDAYLSAMVARDPARAPVTANVRFTQNTRPMALGQGLWESITGVRAYKLFVTDPTAGQVALYTVVDGTDRPGLLTLRMKIEGRRISEIESVYVGIGQTGFGSVDNLVTVNPVWTAVLPPAQRRSRAELIDIADRYLETLEKNIVDHVPFTNDCLRIENGMQTAGRTGAPGLAGLSCRENVNHPMWNYITRIAPRRHLVVDEERGLVSGMYMFRHGGTEPTYTLPGGEVVKHSEAALRRQAVVISELFRIEDGRIRRIEAVMAGGLDHDAPSGW